MSKKFCGITRVSVPGPKIRRGGDGRREVAAFEEAVHLVETAVVEHLRFGLDSARRISSYRSVTNPRVFSLVRRSGRGVRSRR
ncbi:hypothetical protein [Halogeometricum pallidum]|uniref:hypothetical protein n=1 Tax=Halogeometricum pallidum TaxID=411361 RepID=UPI000677A9E7|nr:hypothetical protein [Halogeometricum pallidum]